MSKAFKEVFPTLELEGELAGLLDKTEVTRVSRNRDNTALRIYLSSERLIYKKNIWQLEKQIKNYVRVNDVKIIESYHLSGQYTPESLWEIYKDSVLDELKAYSEMEYNILHSGQLAFGENNTLLLTLVDSMVAREKAEDIITFLEKVICERCGLNLSVTLQYRASEESKLRRNAQIQIEQEVRAIQERVQGNASSSAGTEPNLADSASEHTKPSSKANQNDSKSAGNDGNPAFSKKAFDKKGYEEKGSFRKKYDSKPNNPDVVYGRDFVGDPMQLDKLDGPIGEVIVRGKVLTFETRDIRNEKTIVSFTMTDFTDTIGLKMFVHTEDVPELSKEIAIGKFLLVKGIAALDKYDTDLTISSISGIRKCSDFTTVRMDTAPEKRVELHCHTKMSDMDGVSDVKDIINRAAKWGHKAIAITDHGDVQAFTDANHCVEKDKQIKIIYGVEAYLVDDTKDIVYKSKNQDLNASYVVFDIETTGFSPEVNKIIEIGAVKVVEGKIVDRYSTFINPQIPIPYRIENLTHINDEMVMNERTVDLVLPEFMEWCKDCIMVAHNADFDMSFIKKNCEILGIPCDPTIVDTVGMARVLLPQLNRYKLDTVAKELKVSLESHHRAVDDAGCTAEIFVKFVEMLHDRGVDTLDGLNAFGKGSAEENIKKMNTYHAIILATCDQGRTNLYRLISSSHIKYYNRRPRIPKTEYLKYRDGLLIGSACEAGELYRALLNGRPEEEIARLVNFYDYLEIQPLGNNAFMIRDEDSDIHTEEDLIAINKRIVKLGEQFDKPVVATCDVHFLDPEDEIYRRIIMAGKGFDDADQQAPLYLRTTDEMLAEFDYLGSDKAEEVVITNPNRIADMCEFISPVRPDKCPPVIENSDQMLRDICYEKAHSMYGEVLPDIVQKRLDRELNSIISNGYAVMYIIAQKLVWKSNEDGYLVGSRGSVGSSFAATMSGITEVNPLHAHYLCKHCKYSEFDSERVLAFSGRGGCDMPDAICPNCGRPLSKQGFDIPFETFLGFKGDKEPDIDLNFSGEYQAKAHKYTEIIFGEGQTFKAGTVGTLADKTAYGYVKKYYEERGIRKRSCEIERISLGCVGIHRTTGQHPGGIVVLPMGEEINTFTPVQRPANDMTVDITTTHFDYHSIDHNLLKLDILGHDDPTMIRVLQDMTGMDPTQIPLDDKAVMSLFQNTSALGITPDDIGGTEMGALGIPEFGTDFAMGMLRDTQPKEFSDLIRIAGLSHGTDVWLGNAQTLIEEGKATISTAICTRDDIMIYLIQMGLEPETSFKIMEAVRKGVVAKGKSDKWPAWKEDMIAHGVPDWYIWSCEKIKYMFPKAHAAAYVMMAWRIAYCKVFYPLAYYAAFFSIRAKGFNYEMMCQGKAHLDRYIKDYKEREDTLSNSEQDTLRDMRLVQEMYARGFEFLPIDLFRSHPNRFQIVDGKLLPSFNSIAGLGDNVAVGIAEAAKDGPFLSKDDFRERTKASSTIVEQLDKLGILGDLPESNQLSLFDFQ